MIRVLWFLMVLLALMMSPALCQSGVVEHACACAPGVSECSHEAACSDDPCGWFAVASWRPVPQAPTATVAVMPPTCAATAGHRPADPMRLRAARFDLRRRGVETSTIVLVV